LRDVRDRKMMPMAGMGDFYDPRRRDLASEARINSAAESLSRAIERGDVKAAREELETLRRILRELIRARKEAERRAAEEEERADKLFLVSVASILVGIVIAVASIAVTLVWG